MSENKETSMIGYDPLAWLNEEKHQTHSEVELESDIELSSSAKQFQSAASDLQIIDSEPAKIEIHETESVVNSGNQLSAHIQKIVLESVQNIQNVSQLYEQFLYALQNSEKIDIDASAINSIDTATLQLLLILKHTAMQQQKSVSIDFPSDKFIEAADLLGLSEMLDVNQARSGFF